MRESNENCVTLTAISSAGLELVLDFIYGGSLTLTEENLEDVVPVANYLQIRCVLDCCCDFIWQTLSLENCLEYLKLASNYALDTVASHDTQQDSVIECIHLFILENISDLYLLQKHTKISLLEIMRKLVSSDKIQMSELTLYNIIVDWLLADPCRKEYCDELMKHIRFMLIPLTDLERLQAHPDFDTEVVKDKIEKALKYVSVPVAKKIQWESPVDQVRGRPSVTAIFNVSEWGDHEASPNLHVLLESSVDISDGGDVSSDQRQTTNGAIWTQMPQLPEKFIRSSATSIKNFLFVCGGSPSRRDCHVFDPVTWQWDKIAHMNVGRSCFMLVVHEEELYAIGGKTQDDASIDSIEKYSLRDNYWQVVTHFPVPAEEVAVVSAAGLLYFYGGENDEDEVQSFHSFDSHDCEWKSLPLCPGEDVPYINCSLLSVQNYLCVLGLYDWQSNGIACFHTTTQQWLRFSIPFVNHLGSYNFFQADGQSIYCVGRNNSLRFAPDFKNNDYSVQGLADLDICIYHAMCCWLIIPHDRLETAKLKALRKPKPFVCMWTLHWIYTSGIVFFPNL